MFASLRVKESDQFQRASPNLFVVPQQMNYGLDVFVRLRFWWVHRLSGMSHCPAPLPTPPPSRTSSLCKAAQRPIRGAFPLIRVTNWRSAGAKTPPHLQGHVTFKEVRRVKGRAVEGVAERGGGVLFGIVCLNSHKGNYKNGLTAEVCKETQQKYLGYTQ